MDAKRSENQRHDDGWMVGQGNEWRLHFRVVLGDGMI